MTCRYDLHFSQEVCSAVRPLSLSARHDFIAALSRLQNGNFRRDLTLEAFNSPDFSGAKSDTMKTVPTESNSESLSATKTSKLSVSNISFHSDNDSDSPSNLARLNLETERLNLGIPIECDHLPGKQWFLLWTMWVRTEVSGLS